MARPRLVAKLEWHAGSNCYGIRYSDWAKLKPNGEPTKRLTLIDAGNGRRVSSIAEAQPYLDAYLAKAPAAAVAKRVMAGTPGTARLTLVQLAQEFKRLHAGHCDVNAYVEAAETFSLPPEKGGCGAVYPDDLTVTLVEDWRAARAKGVSGRLRLLLSVLNWAPGRKLCSYLSQEVKQALRPPQSRWDEKDVLTRAEWEETLALAKLQGQEALAHCLSTFGWRPISATRAKVGLVDLAAGMVGPLPTKDPRKKDRPRRAHRHRLFPESIELLRPLVEGRGPDEMLFLNNKGLPWEEKRGRAVQMIDWYKNHIARAHPGKGNIKAWKLVAIWRMDLGLSPWSKPVRDKMKIEFTGHKTEAIIKRYNATNAEEMNEVVGGEMAVTDFSGGWVVDTRHNPSQTVSTSPDDNDKVIRFPVRKGK